MTKYKCERTYVGRHIDRNCKRAGYRKIVGRFLSVTALGSLLLTGCGAIRGRQWLQTTVFQ